MLKKIFSKQRLFSYLLILITLSLFKIKACVESSLKKTTSVTLGLNWKPEPQFGGFYEAQISGEFTGHQLEVKILEGGSGTPTVQMLTNNKIDYGIVSAEELIIANEKNPTDKLIALYAVYKTNPQMILTHEERGFKNLKDVFQNEGTLAIQQGLSYFQFLKKLYQPLKVRLVPYLGGIAHFQNDKKFSQQGFVNSENLLAEKAGLKTKIFLIAESGFNPYTTVLATQAERLKKSAPQVEQMRDAVRAGWARYLESPSATNKHMMSLNKAMDVSVMEKAAAGQKDLIEIKGEKLGEMKLLRWKKLQEQLKELGLIKQLPDPQEYFLKQ